MRIAILSFFLFGSLGFGAGGGLQSYPTTVTGPNTVLNPGFESWTSMLPDSWTEVGGNTTIFSQDTTTKHSGTSSLKILNPNTCSFVCDVRQSITLTAGIYNLTAWIKTSSIAGTDAYMVMRVLGSGDVDEGDSQTLSGTNDWTQVTITSMVLSAGTHTVQIYPHAGPSGTAWIDDITLTRQSIPLSAFMKYPNYRGNLFTGESGVAQFSLLVDPPDGTLADYYIQRTLKTGGGSTISTVTLASSSTTATVDISAQSAGTYDIFWKLLLVADDSVVYSYPAYRVQNLSTKPTVGLWYDKNQRIMFGSTPTFLLGTYDSGLDSFNDPSQWTTQFNTLRRLNQLPINFYLNYFFGENDNTAWAAMMTSLQAYNPKIWALGTNNCETTNPLNPAFWFSTADDATLQARFNAVGFAGMYLADECGANLAGGTLTAHLKEIALANAGVNLGVNLGNSGLPLWRDSLDLLGTDPYPMFGADPPGGYDFSLVSNWTLLNQAAVQSSRPIITTIQFFKFTSLGRWPTQAELRNMSYMAIADGANGLLYWSLGVNALAYICDGSDPAHSPAGSDQWCQAKIDEYGYLVNVVTELNTIQSPLSAVDDTTSLVGHTQAGIHTRVKTVDGISYVICSNTTNGTLSPVFTWNANPTGVTVYNEARSITPTGATWTDSFTAYAAHVYEVQTSFSSLTCDLNHDGLFNVLDVQLQVNQYLGITACTNKLDGTGTCTLVDVQRVIDAALGSSCHIGP